MDLRPYLRDEGQILLASQLLNYQPFILSDDLQTGVAHSWIYREEGGRNSVFSEWVADRRVASPEYWNRFTDANRRLRTMYEDWLDVIAARFPGGSLVDVGCNSGYFPIRAEMKGMRHCAGYEVTPYGQAVEFLNRILGTSMRFYQQGYDFYTHSLPGCHEYDVAVASVIMCHLPDPLNFLACLGKIARKAVFLFAGMADEDQLTIHYSHPNRFYKDRPFPYGFDNDTGLSRGLLYKSMEWLGFKERVEVPYRESWLPRQWYGAQKALLFSR